MSRSIVLALTLLIPDRLPSLIGLVGFWLPPAVIGLLAADLANRSATRVRPALIYTLLTTVVLGYAAAWFLFNLGRMPPYIPGATFDPTFAPPQAVKGLAVFTSALVLPGSLIACLLAFRLGARLLKRIGNPSNAERRSEA
jgi:hypothetical protein